LQIKAIEALGRLRESNASPLLRPLAEAKKFWSWQHPRELRITAFQALKKIDPEWARDFLPRCGLSDEELKLAALDPVPNTPWLRQRRYERLSLPRPLKGTVHMGKCEYPISIQLLSLGGGMAQSKCQIKPGNTVPMEFKSGVQSIHTRVLVREAGLQELTFELVQIDNENRGRLRRPLAGLHSQGGWKSAAPVVSPARL
jgi:hypothetical protein